MSDFLHLIVNSIDQGFKIYHTTASSGTSQPGMFSLEWKLLKKANKICQCSACIAPFVVTDI